jgi:hypothetical protein
VRLPARWSLPEILEAARHAPPAPPRRRAGRTR